MVPRPVRPDRLRSYFLSFGLVFFLAPALTAQAPLAKSEARYEVVVRKDERIAVRDGTKLDRAGPQRQHLHHATMLAHQLVDRSQWHQGPHLHQRRAASAPGVAPDQHVLPACEAQRVLK